MFKHKSSKQLKSRTQKRRVSSHHFPPARAALEYNDYQNQRANRIAINKLKRQPELIEQVESNLENKRSKNPQQPQLMTWQALIDSLKKPNSIDDFDIHQLEQVVLDFDNQAKLLREHSALDCLFED